MADPEGKRCNLMGKKKVLLVNTNTEESPYPVPPVGLCMLASRLEVDYLVKVYDGVFDKGRNLLNAVFAFSPDYIGFSIRNVDDVVDDRQIFYIEEILLNFIEPVRKIVKVPLILGGSGFSIFPVEIMKLSGADYGIIGEGVEMLPLLLDHLEKGSNPAFLPNLLTKDSVGNKNFSGIQSLKKNSTIFSRIDQWVDFMPYASRGAYSIQTKRGCSHGCIYCTYPLIEGRKFVTRKVADIVDEISEAKERLGNVTFEFVDSTFNDPEFHAEEICSEIIARKLKVKLRTMGINPRHTSRRLFELMISAGFTQIDATPDTASEKMLKNMGKGFSLEEIKKMAILIKEFNLPTMWFFLFGGPGEDAATFQETIDFIDQYVNPADLVYMTSGLRIYPGTPVHKIAISEQRFKEKQSLFQPPVFYYSEHLGKETLDRMISDAEKIRPNCIPANETHPPKEMILEAIERRKKNDLTEPMFRTLLRIRKEWKFSHLI